MKKRIFSATRHLLLLSILLFTQTFTSYAQNVSTEGTDFWLGFMPHDYALPNLDLSIFISTSQDTVTGTISVEGIGVISNFTLGANSSASLEYSIPDNRKANVITSIANSVRSNSIHIETDQPVSVYALNKANRFSADATIVLPTVTLGKKYFAVSHKEGGLPSEILIIGVEDDTDIDIVPTANLNGGVSAGNTTSITLDKGETYLVQSNGDLTGTQISTQSSATGDCKNFSVFSGTDRTPIGGGCAGSQDHLFQNLYPFKTWGANFTIIPYQDRSGDIIKIIAGEDNTNVTVQGVTPFTLDEGEVRQLNVSNVSTASADKPISITQFSRSAGCDGGSFGDPFMITLSPNEQLLKKITFTAFDIFDNSFTYYVDILSPTNGKNSVTLTDGTGSNLPLNFIDLSSGVSYAQVTLNINGEHFITSDSGFIANVYGFGRNASSFESFGYTTGASLNNLNFSIISIDSGQFMTGDTEELCLGNDINFSPDIDTVFKFFEWDMGDGTIYSTKDVAHTYLTPGIYNVSVKASTAIGDCATSQTAIKTVEVIKADFGIRGPASVCPETNDIEYTPLNPKGDYDYTWTVVGGNIASGATADTLRIDWGLPSDTASITGIAINDLGCDDTTSLAVIINDRLEPSAPTGEDSVCYAGLTEIYEAVLANGNGYEWFAEGGTVITDPADPFSHITQVTWDTTATEWKLWFKEFSLSDTLCEGVSDTFALKTILPEIKTQSVATVDVSCFGEADGSFNFTAQGGVGVLSYIYDNDTVTGPLVVNGLVADTYTVQVLDETLCAVFPEIVINQPDSLILAATPVDILCFSDSTGSIDINITGGTVPYSYDWGPDYTQDTAFLDGLPIGSYQVAVVDSNNCPVSSDVIMLTQPDSMEFSLAGSDSVCQFTTDKAYTITDVETDTYTWMVDGGTILSGQGTKDVLIEWGIENPNASIKILSENTDGCISDTLILPIEIYAFPQPAAAIGVDSLCFEDTLNISYTTPHTTGHGYNWFVEGGVLTVDPADPTGTSVSVDWNTDGTRKLWFEEYILVDTICAAYSDTLEITVFEKISATIDVQRVSCFAGSDGIIAVSPSGGFPDYSYGWSHDAALTSDSATNLPIGTYTVVVTDDIGCTGTFIETIIQPAAPLVTNVLSTVDVLCNGEETGEAEISIAGGTVPYTIQWDDPNAQTSTAISGLPAGLYQVLVTDSSGCEILDTVTIIEPDPFTYTLDTVPSSCKLTEGTATINVSGATPPFDYDWQTTNVSNRNTGEELAPGSNLVIITDSSGCEYQVDAYITSKEPELYFPNTFTPNGDDLNDIFHYIATCNGQVAFTVYNRWGDAVFQTEDITEGWDGKDNAKKDLPQGMYLYRIQYEVELDGRYFKIEKRGAITLIR